MRFYTLSGKLVNKNLNKYIVNWDKPCRSIVQFKVKQFLKPFWKNYICMEEVPCLGTLLKVDFVNISLKIAIETSGLQHETYNKFFHRNSPANFLHGIKNDVKKEQWLKINNIKLIIIYENEINLLSKQFFKDKFNIDL